VIVPALILALAPIVASGQPDSATALPEMGYIPRPTLQIGAGAGCEMSWAKDIKEIGMVPDGLSRHIDLRAPRLLEDSWGLQARAELQHQDARGYNNAGFSLDARQLSLLVTYRPSRRAEVSVGAFVGYRSIGTMRYYIVPVRVGQRLVNTEESTPAATDGMRVGGLALLSFPIDLGENVRLAPEFRLRADLIPSDASVASTSPIGLGVGITLDYSLFALPSLRRAPDLSSEVDIYALDDEGEVAQEAFVHGGDIGYTRHLELAPVISFDAASPDLSPRYVVRSAFARFSPDSIARLDPVTIDRHRPDLLGAWLSVDQGACRLIATVVEGEGEGVARARAESLRRYLAGTWGMAAARMTIATEPGMRREVRVESGGGGMMRLDATWSAPRMVVPPVRIEPDIDSEAGVKAWRLRLERDGREIASQTSDTGAGRMNMRRLMGLLTRDTSRGPLIADLTVEDLAGSTSTARDTLRFRYAGSIPLGRVSEYLLLGIAPSEELVARIIAAADTGTRVTIAPLSDRAGVREAALELARKLHDGGVDARVAPYEDAEDLEGMSIEITPRGTPLP
jgi:hypothetical protein